MIPVLIFCRDTISGVSTWAKNISVALGKMSSRFDVRLVHTGEHPSKDAAYHHWAPTGESVYHLLRASSPAIVIPNWVNEAYVACAELNQLGHQLRCVGLCRADSETEYYLPLAYYAPIISCFGGVSRECSEQLRIRMPERASDVFTLPNPVHFPLDMRKNYQQQPIRIVYLGRLVQEQKRVMDLIPLLETLEVAGVDYALDVIGVGPDADLLKVLVRSADFAKRVCFLGFVPHDDVLNQLSQYAIFIQLSDYEGTSNSLLEAMAHGCVPVVTDAGSGIADVVSDGVEGFVVPVGDMQALAARIAMLARDPGQLSQLGLAAQAKMIGFGLDEYIPKFIEVLDYARERPPLKWPDSLPLRYTGFRSGLPEMTPPHMDIEKVRADVDAIGKGYWRSWLLRAERAVRGMGRRGTWGVERGT